VRKTLAALALPVLAALVLLAGCGGSGSNYGGEGSNTTSGTSGNGATGSESSGRYGSSAATEGASASGAATVSTGSASGVGTVLVDSKGMTLYYFEKDKKGGKPSACNGPCAEGWPPLTTSGAAQAMKGVKSSMLGTIKRSDGTTQVTYAGWPLYTYVGDTQPGEDNGTDSKAFGAAWYPLHPNGKKAGS
jgi:predicted lipoprotein with Yx(FWY)xxD motif